MRPRVTTLYRIKHSLNSLCILRLLEHDGHTQGECGVAYIMPPIIDPCPILQSS